MIRKVTNSNPAFKKKIKLKIIQMGDNVKIEVICLFLRFFLLAINTGNDDAIYKVIRNAANRNTV
ncbi:hypothetical protein KAM576c_20500 [Enterobacter asburiae]|nr:hypothetical protein KAM576c_20500 [Enterobacter asburiae]